MHVEKLLHEKDDILVTLILYIKVRFQDCSRKHMLYRIDTPSEADIFIEN